MTAILDIDFETTGLHIPSLTLLEGAWVIAGLDGVVRHPMQHRYLKISKSHNPIYPVHLAGENVRWCDDISLMTSHSERFARGMAEESGLFNDWIACNPDYIVNTGDELTRLLLDDIATCCGPDEPVHICGAGAARFDFSLLALHCPRVVLPPGQRGQVHYRPIDTSGNMTGLLGNNYEEALIKWFVETDFTATTCIELDDVPRFCYSNRNVGLWLTKGDGQHRSAPDVARSLVVQRALWSYGASLRDALKPYLSV